VGHRGFAGLKNYRIIPLVTSIDLHLKVEADLAEGEDPRKLAAEICRQLRKFYGVRSAEVTNIIEHGGTGQA
jgi:hypothetical protein